MTEDEAYAVLAARRWPNGPRCPHCGEERHYKAPHTSRSMRLRCARRTCRKDYSVTHGTVAQQSHLELRFWLAAESAYAAGISQRALAQQIGIDKSTAWEVWHRLHNNGGKLI